MKVDLCVVFCLLAVLHGCAGLTCYSCNMNAGEKETYCVDNPDLVTTSSPTVTCDKKYCTIFRQEHVSTGLVNSFSRACESKPIHLNEVITDSEFVTYYRSCTTSFCNKWDGKSASGGGGSGGGGSGGVGDGSDPNANDGTVILGLGTGGYGGGAGTIDAMKPILLLAVTLTLTFKMMMQ